MSSFEVIPAIDLKDGRCVRLRQGAADAVTVYSDDPVAMARAWAEQGASRLHIVDLDGAFQGRPVHRELVGRMAAAAAIPVQFGGGLRTDEDIQSMLDAGVQRVVLGTRACANPGDLRRLVDRYGAAIAVGIDARNGFVQVRGWVEITGTRAVDLAVDVAKTGVSTLIYTDTSTDGMLTGPNYEGIRLMCGASPCDVIASGGVAAEGDVLRLRDLNLPNLRGAIVGKALYEGRVTVRGLRAALAGEGVRPC